MVRKATRNGVLFLLMLVLFTSLLNPIFILKTDHRGKLIEGLYNRTDDIYDVVLMGSSHMNGGIDPNVLWQEFGITSFNFATGGQPLDVTYYLLKEVLRTRKNPIIVIDLFYLGLTDKYGDKGYVRNVLDNMRFSLNKLAAIMNCTPVEDRLSYLFPIMKYHDRWSQLTLADLKYDSSSSYTTKGFGAGTDKYGKDFSGDLSTTETIDLPPKTREYLDKIISLANENSCKLVFINTPYDYNCTAGSSNWVKEPAKMFNKVAEISKENNIPFINYNNKMKEIGFNFKEDMTNSSHLNLWGARKVTLDLGKFLKECYGLADHRKDERFKQWNLDYMLSQAATASAYNRVTP